MARVFVSYRRVAPDNGIAMALYRRLSDRGHDVFLDSERVHLGDRWPRTIREALDRTEWFVALVSLAYLHSTNCIDDELVIAARRLADGGLSGLLTVRLAFDGEFPTSVRDVLTSTQAFVWRGEDDPEASTEAMSEHVLTRLPRPTTLVKGMRAFDAIDADAFMELCPAAMVAACRAELAKPGVTVIHGVSGAGKTSFLRAGVLPRLPPDAHRLITASTGPLDLAVAAGDAAMVVVDQFEQVVVALGRDRGAAAGFDRDAVAWLDGGAERRLALVIRDEYRTPLEAVFPGLAAQAHNFALLPLEPGDAARALAAILDSAGVEYDRAVLNPLVQELVDGAPPRVRPALLQLIAHEARESGERLDAHAWGGMATSRRAFFERHIRTTVLDVLGASISRIDAARSLRGLTAGELKAAPRTIDEVVADEEVPVELARRVLDVASAPHARVASVELHGDVERFELVHDLFAAAIHGLVKEEEARRREEEARRREVEARRRSVTARRVALVLGGLVIAAIVSAGLAGLMWRRAGQARDAAQRQERRENASKLAAMAERYRGESPSRALALAAEALDATGSDGVSSDAMRAAYDALAETHGPALRGSSSDVTGLAMSFDGEQVAVVDKHSGMRVWKLADLQAWPRVLAVPDGVDLVSLTFDHRHSQVIAWSEHAVWSWDLRALTPRPIPLADRVERVVVSADRGTLVALVSGSAGDARATKVRSEIRVWDLAAEDLERSMASFSLPIADPRELVCSPTATWIAVTGPEGVARIERRSRAIHHIPMSQLTSAIASVDKDRFHTANVLAVTDGGALVLDGPVYGGPSFGPPVVVASVGADERLHPRAVRLPFPVTTSAWGLASEGWFLMLYVTERDAPGSLRQACALVFDDHARTLAFSKDHVLLCPRVTGPPVVSRHGWVAMSGALARMLDFETWSTVSFARPRYLRDVRDDVRGRIVVRPASDLDDQGRIAVMSTGEDVVIWRLAGAVVDGRTWSGPDLAAAASGEERAATDIVSGCRGTLALGASAEYSPDGRWAVVHLAPATSPSSSWLWSCDDLPHRVTRLGENGWVLARTATFSRDGRWLALASGSQLGVILVELTRGREPAIATVERLARLAGDRLVDLVFRPDSQQLAVLTYSLHQGVTPHSQLAVWEIDSFRTGGEPFLSLTMAGTDGQKLRYDGDLLSVIDARGARLTAWPITPSAIRDQAMRHGGRNLSRDEWGAAFGDLPYHKTFADLPEPAESTMP